MVSLLVNRTSYNHFFTDIRCRLIFLFYSDELCSSQSFALAEALLLGGLVLFFSGSKGLIISHSLSVRLLVYGIFHLLYPFMKIPNGFYKSIRSDLLPSMLFIASSKNNFASLPLLLIVPRQLRSLEVIVISFRAII